MNSKERVHLSLQRKTADRVPVFMWYHPETTKRLGRLLEIPAKYVPLTMGDDMMRIALFAVVFLSKAIAVISYPFMKCLS